MLFLVFLATESHTLSSSASSSAYAHLGFSFFTTTERSKMLETGLGGWIV